MSSTSSPFSFSYGGSSGTPPESYNYTASETNAERTNTTIPAGSSNNRGVVLTQDSLSVPLEVQFAISNDPTNTSRPTLPVIFRIRDADDGRVANLAAQFYLSFRANLSPILQNRLLNDENELFFEDRDPDLIALDSSLYFEADIAAKIAAHLEANTAEVAEATKTDYIKKDQMKISSARQNIISYSQNVLNSVIQHVNKIGANDPSHDIFMHVCNQAQEALNLLNIPDETA